MEIPPDVIALSGWQVFLILLNTVTNLSFQNASILAALLCVTATTIVLLRWFLPVFTKNKMSVWKQLGVILGISIATPVSLLWFVDGLMYLGYIGITSFHNPTVIMLRPLALLQFIYACKLFAHKQLTKRQILIAGLVSLLGTYVKPNFAICIVPALIVVSAYRLLKKKTVNIKGLAFGFFIPIGVILIIQFLFTFNSNIGGDAGIAFMPFAVMDVYSKHLLSKFILSILFPVFVTLLYIKKSVFDVRMILGWLIFLIGAFYTYFLAETGSRFYDGNFGWSGEITLVILFALSTLFYLEMPHNCRLRDFVLKVVWAGHVVVGVIYYFYCYFNNLYF